MNSVGERLRLERLRQGRDISEIATQTRINSKYIEAIETDDLRGLPGAFFYRSFVKQYAEVLGLDEAEIEQDLESMLGPAAQVYAPPPQAGVPIEVPPMPAAVRSEASRQIPISLILLVFVILGTSLLYSLWQHSRRVSEVAPEAAPVQQHETAPAPAPAPVAAAPAAVAPQTAPVATQTIPSAAAPPLQPAGIPAAGSIGTVQVVASSDVWIRLNSDGKNLVERILKAGESRTLPLYHPGVMRVGDAAAIQVWWKGQQLGPIGPSGQLRDVTFSEAGARISLPPKPKPPEPNPDAPAATPPPIAPNGF